MIEPLPADTSLAAIPRTHSLTGWPRLAECSRCGGEAVMCSASHDSATYECRGSLPHPPHSAYSADRCGRVWDVKRSEGVA